MKNQKIKKAYSLLELSIVIVIISILVTGALSVSVGSINSAKIKTTKERLEQIYTAMGVFLTTNNRLPCPASILDIKSSSPDYAIEEDGDGGCDTSNGVFKSDDNDDLFYGMVPARSLGLSTEMAEDAFGSKIIYIVNKNFTYAINLLVDNPDFDITNFSTATSTSIMTVNEKQASITQAITADAIMALISAGPNKAGAHNANSSTQNLLGSDTDENDNVIPDDYVYSTTPGTADFDNIIVATSSSSDNFDDIVLYKTRNNFIEDFNAMFLIPCVTTIDNSSSAFPVGTSAYYGHTIYATSSTCSDGTIFSRKCESYGQWLPIVNSCADGGGGVSAW